MCDCKCKCNCEPAFDPSKPVETRDGRKARILATDLKPCSSGLDWPIAAAVSIDGKLTSVEIIDE